MGSNPGLAGRDTCVLEQDINHNCFISFRWDVKSYVCVLGYQNKPLKESRTLIVEEKGFTPVFLVHIASALVYRFPQASKLQCLSVLLRDPWFHYQKCIIIKMPETV